MTGLMGARCSWAIKYGVTLHTRCHLVEGHVGAHEGKGLSEFPYQRIEWFVGDSREYQTDRKDLFSWEV